jgi:ubiquinone/menaquinone biosynthesis C-methylase UbiE
MLDRMRDWYEANVFDPAMERVETKGMSSIRAKIIGSACGGGSTSSSSSHLLVGGVLPKVLEIGMGPGMNLPHYPDEISELWSTTLGESVSSLAAEKAKARAITIHHLQGDRASLRLPYETSTFDVVVATLILCSIEDQRRFVSEVHRVLKPGARWALFEHGFVSGESSSSCLQKAMNPIHQIYGLGCTLTRPFPAQILSENGFSFHWKESLSPQEVGVGSALASKMFSSFTFGVAIAQKE